MRRAGWRFWATAGVVVAMAAGLTAEVNGAGTSTQDKTVRYLLATIKAFRTVYMHSVVEQTKKAGIQAKEHWLGDDHAIMLPFQMIKLAGNEIKGDFKNLEIGVVSLTPIYSANFPQTPAEVDALHKLMEHPELKVVTFADGNQFKGLSADFAIEHDCADCHNHHPNSPRHDFKKGDLMGAIVVRLRE